MEICFIKSKFILSFSYLEENHWKSMFCFRCGIELATQGLFVLVAEQKKKKKITLIGDNSLAEREVIGYFFYCGYDYKRIVHLLKTHCDISLSERTLKTRLQKCNLRKNSNTDDSVLRTIINRELETPSQCLGYRGMWHLLRKSYSIQVPWDRVMQILQEEDHGNDTGVMAGAHCTLRQNADAHRYGTSVANQRIENFWSHFRCTFTSCLVNFFKQWMTKGYQSWETTFICNVFGFLFPICYNSS